MTEVTRILNQIEGGDPSAADELLPLVYKELRKLAAAKFAQERSGQTLQPTALVHEAYLRLVDVEKAQHWDSRGHFFAAASEAMRRILVDSARRKKRRKHGGDQMRHDLDNINVAVVDKTEEVLSINDALKKLEVKNAPAAAIVKLRYFAGLTIPESAEALAISPRRADQVWAYAKAWLLAELEGDQ